MKRPPFPPQTARRVPHLQLEELEPRLLFSADAGALLGVPLAAPLTVTQTPAAVDAPLSAAPGPAAQATAPVLQAQDSQAREAAGLEIAIVDLAIDDASALIRSLEAQRDAGRNIEIFTIGRGEDGLARISAVLADRQDVQAVHVFSHGDAAGLQLGTARLDSAALLHRFQDVAGWSQSIATDGDLLLYGCNLAASEEGRALIADLALLSGADVAASDDLTGAAALGGDWELEFRQGQVEAAVAVSAATLQGWNNVLATVTLRDGTNGYAGTTDTFIYTSMGVGQNVDKGASTTLEAGEDGTGGQAQLLLKFEDLVGYGPNQIPPGSTITGVTLTIYVLNEPTFTNPSFSIHRMLVPWSGSSTWGSMGDGITTFFPSEARAAADQTITMSADNTSKTFASNAAMIATVQGWVNDPSTNHGWYTDNGDYSARTTFASSEASTVANRPTLTITYTAPSTTITSDGGGSSAAVNAPENQTAVTTVTATGGMAAFSYAITGGADAARFNIDSSTGVLTFVAAPNYEAPADSDGNNVYQVTVSVSDGTTTDTQAIAVTVTNVNDIAPTLSGTGAVLVYTENAGPVAVDAALAVSDADSSQLTGATVQITGNYVAGQDTLNFTAQNGITGSWNAASGLLTLTGTASVANYQAALRSVTYSNSSDNPNTSSRTISILVNDGLFSSNTVGRTVSVSAVNDAPVITSQGGAASAALSVAENATAVTTVTVTDPDGPSVTYALSGADAALFSIDNATGALRFNTAPDHENRQDSGADNVYNVTVTVSDGILTDAQALSITVTDVDEFNVGAVTDSNAAANSVTENAANGSAVGITASAVDADGSNNTITYSLTNNAGGRFAINSSTGVVTVANGTLLNYEAATSHGITVLATSADGSTSSQSFTINLADVDEFNVGAVTDSNAAANTVAENAANGSTVGITASASDADGSNNTITYSLSNNAGGRFAINSSTGVVTVANGALLNYETATSHGITVLATSADGSTSSRSFTINLSDVDEFNVGAVTDSNAAANSVAENAANGSTAGITALAADADGSNNAITYTLSNTAGGRFAINASTGVVTVANGALLNYEAASSHNITVLATSADGSTSSQSFTINLADVDEFNVGAVVDSDVAVNTVAENAANGSTVGITASASDADGTNNTITYTLSNNAGGRFAINSSTGVVTVADGTLLNHEAATSHGITVLATSADGSTSSQSFTINLADVDEFNIGAVTDSDPTANTVAENAANGSIVGITASAQDADSSNNAVTYALSDSAGGRFAIDAGTGIVRVADAAQLNYETDTSHTITVVATSADGSTSSQSFTVSVTDVDEFNVGAVSDSNAAANAVAENATNGSTVGLTALALDADATNNTITYTLSDSAGGRFAIDSTTGVVTVAGAGLLDYETSTSHSITVLATSADGSSASQTFVIGINDVSEVGVSAISDTNASTNRVAENAANGSVVGITAHAVDPDGDTVSYSLSDNAGGRFAINATTGVVTVANGTLLNREAANAHSITVLATSADGTTSSQTFSIALQDVDEFDVSAIADTNAAANTVAENAANGSTVGITARATDADATSNSVTYTLSDSAGGRFAINAGTGIVTVANSALLNREAAASHTITVQATSADGSTSTQSFTINLTDIDEFNVGAVTDGNGAANTVAENAANGSTVGIAAVATDADATNNTVTYSLSNSAGGRFAIDSVSGVVTVANGALLNYEAATSHSITVVATSVDGSSSSQSFTIDLADADEFNIGTVSDSNATANAVAENALNGTMVGITAAASDADATNNTVSYSLSDSAGGRFAINAATGVVSVADRTLLDYEASASHSITVLATSSDGSTSSQSFTINLIDDNEFDVGPVADANAAPDGVAENAANGSTVGITAHAVDADGSDNTVTYALSDSAGGRFAIDAATGVVTVANGGLLDREAAASHSITVVASASDGSTSSQTFTVNLSDVDEFNVGPVSDIDAAANAVAENAGTGTAVGITAAATDADATLHAITYSLSDSAGGRFAIDAGTGVVTVANGSLLNYEATTSHTIVVVATSADGSTGSQTFTINLSDADEFNVGAVTDSNAATNRVAENAATGSAVGITAVATDADATHNTVTYALSNSAGGRFAIDAVSGVVTVADGALLNYETAASHTITVQATSADGSSSSRSFTINLTDVDEFDVGAVTDSNVGPNTVTENAASGSAVGLTASATDADATSNTISYSLSDSAGGRFAINASTGVVTVANGSLLNREAAGSHSITVVATSADGSTSSQSFTITLADVDEFDIGAVTDGNPAANTVAENAANGSAVGLTASATDADSTTHTVTYALSDSAGGRFAINAATGVVSVADGTRLDFEAATSHSITVVATSADGSTSSQTFMIQVSNVNEAPVVTGPASVQAVEQQASALHGTGWSVSDPDGAGGVLIATLSVTDGRLSVEGGNTGVVVAGSGTGTVVLTGSAAQLNALLAGLQGGRITYFIDSDTPPPTVGLVLSANDQGHSGPGGAQTGSRASAVLITPVHDAPTASDDRHTTGFNTPLRLEPAQLMINDRSPEGAPMDARLLEGPRHGTLTLTSDGRWLYVPHAGFSGSDSFTYLVHDGQADSNTATVFVDVQAAPVGPALPNPASPPVTVEPPAGPDPAQAETPAPSTAGDAATDDRLPPTQPEPEAPVPQDPGGNDTLAPPLISQTQPGSSSPVGSRTALQDGRGFAAGSQDGVWHKPDFDGIVLVGQTLDETFSRNVLSTAILSLPLDGIHFGPGAGGTMAGKDGALGEILEISTEKLQTVGAVLSVGAVWWAARGATLLTSLLVSTPVWRSLDPLPVLAAPGRRDEDEEDAPDSADNAEAELMFDDGRRQGVIASEIA